MLKLYAVLLGGRAKGCNIELHDVVFVVAHSLEDAYLSLINKWFGIDKGLHIDSHIELSNIDGYDISVSKDKALDGLSLYFVNIGGYKDKFFGEIHEMRFYICHSKDEAISKAKHEIGNSLSQPHADDKHNVDELLIDDIARLNIVDKCYIHCKKSNKLSNGLCIQSQYIRLDTPEIRQQLTLLDL